MDKQDTKKPRNEKRTALIALSQQAKELRDNMAEAAETPAEALYWSSRTVNEMLLNHIYDTKGATEFNTFGQWKAQGATIKKGEKAFVIWGQPLNKQRAEEAKKKGEELEQDDEMDYFPMCYLFSDKQVTTAQEKEQKTEARNTVKEPEPVFETADLDNLL